MDKNMYNGWSRRLSTNRCQTVLMGVSKTEPNRKFTAIFIIKKINCSK